MLKGMTAQYLLRRTYQRRAGDDTCCFMRRPAASG